MNTVYTNLPLDEQNEDEQIITTGDDILTQFYYGNYTDAVNMMIKDGVSPESLAEYLESVAIDCDMTVEEIYNGHFTYSLFASIGQSYEQR